jgi:SOS response regulatory protein OraA/RecX
MQQGPRTEWSGERRSSADRRAKAAERRARRAEVTDPDVAMEAAAAFVAVRPRSISETSRRLRHLGYRPDIVNVVLARLVELGYLDDREFARAWVESRDRVRPRGQIALRAELGLKGISREIVESVLAERAEGDADSGVTGAGHADSGVSGIGHPAPERAAAERLLARRRSALDREPDLRKRRQKAYALLARNGFDPETCRDVAATIVAAGGADEQRET